MPTRIQPENIDTDMLTREQRLALQRRGVYQPGGARVNPQTGADEWGRGGFYNPQRIAGTVPESAGNVGPNYNERLEQLSVNRRDEFFGRFPQEARGSSFAPRATEGRSPPPLLRPAVPDYAGQGMPPDTRPIISGMPQFAGMVGPGGRMMGTPAVAAGGGLTLGGTQGTARTEGTGAAPVPGQGIVEQLLQGPPVGGRTTDDGRRKTEEAGPPAAPVSPPMAWGGVPRPVSLRPGESLLEARPPFTGVEGDPALAERKAEFDRNLPEFLQRPFSSREQFERDLVRLPGAGQEILGHIQQRAAENMPAGFAQELAQIQAKREAATKAMAHVAGEFAGLEEWKKTATEAEKAGFEEGYEWTPKGVKPRKMTSAEKFAQAKAEWLADPTTTQEELAEFEKEYMMTPEGPRRRVAIYDAVTRAAEAAAKAEAGRGQRSEVRGQPEGQGIVRRVISNYLPGMGGTAGEQTPDAGRQTTAGRPEEGQTATNPTTGQRVIFRNGKWELM